MQYPVVSSTVRGSLLVIPVSCGSLLSYLNFLKLDSKQENFPNIFSASQVRAAAKGEDSLFALRLTLLGDGNSTLSVSPLCILGDGELLDNSWTFPAEMKLRPEVDDCHMLST